jgi:hypothetical protein
VQKYVYKEVLEGTGNFFIRKLWKLTPLASFLCRY